MSVKRKRPPRIALVVACTQRKRLVPPIELSLRSIEGSPEERSVEWRRRIRSLQAQARPVHDLYIGDHWRAACDAYELALHYSSRAELWVISAGYGLIMSRKPVKAYSATFGSGSPDSVWRGPQDGDRRMRLRAWWAALRHDSALAELLDSDGTVVIAAGAPYVEALGADLHVALEDDPSSERVSVISAGSRENGALLPASGRLRRTFGGTDAGLNARVLAFLAASAAEHRFRRSTMSAALAALAANSPATVRTVGRAACDDRLIQEITAIRRREPAISRTQALRELRQSGIACEQSRFASLWTRMVID